MSLLAEEKNIKLTVDAAQPVYVMGDAMRLKQVIVNLVDNAIRYTPDGGRIVVHLWHDAVHATLTVSDTGIGIPEAALPFVFDRFYRTDEARSRESGGTGLGLAIVKAICGAHDGNDFDRERRGEEDYVAAPASGIESNAAAGKRNRTRGKEAERAGSGKRWVR